MTLSTLRSLVRKVHSDEGGQVTILFTFCSVAAVLLLAFILNTAQQTSRKIQMQDAADSAAVAGATWMARGMNLIALDNKGMADIIGVMLDIHAARQAWEAMPAAIDALIAALSWCPPCWSFSAKIGEEEFAFWIPELSPVAIAIDNRFSGPAGVGWDMLNTLDGLNSAIANSIPPIAAADALYYGHVNGLPDTIGIFPVASLPVKRGGKERLVMHANNEDYSSPTCCLSVVEPLTWTTVIALCIASPATPCLSGFLYIPLFYFAIASNINSLENGQSASQFKYTGAQLNSNQSLQNAIAQYNSANSGNGKVKPINLNSVSRRMGAVTLGLGPLRWPDPSPQPMMLTDIGGPGDTDPPPPALPDLSQVRRRLQFLGAAWAPGQRSVALGTSRFVNPAPLYGWLTYAQADVYNPVEWDMFHQQWRARLARATNLDEDWAGIASRLGGKFSGWTSTSFVNNH